MAYTKHTWKERLGTGLNKFKDTITGTIMALVNQPDSVTQAGTPIRADWLNEMEEGIYQAHVTADAALPKTGKAADSAKLDGREVSNIPVAGGIPAWSTPDKILQATKFKEDGVDLKNKYWPLKSILPSTLNANNLLDEGVYFSNGTAFTNIPATTSGTYAVLVVRRRNSGGLDPVIQEFYTTDGRHFVRSKANNVWNAWKCTTVKYGTGTPPSSLAPGEIYVQY